MASVGWLRGEGGGTVLPFSPPCPSHPSSLPALRRAPPQRLAWRMTPIIMTTTTTTMAAMAVLTVLMMTMMTMMTLMTMINDDDNDDDGEEQDGEEDENEDGDEEESEYEDEDEDEDENEEDNDDHGDHNGHEDEHNNGDGRRYNSSTTSRGSKAALVKARHGQTARPWALLPRCVLRAAAVE